MPKEYSSSHFVAISARGPWGLLLCDCAGDVPSVPRLRTSGALPRPGDSHTAACLQGAHGPLSRSSPLRRGPLAYGAGLDRQRSRLGAPGPCAYFSDLGMGRSSSESASPHWATYPPPIDHSLEHNVGGAGAWISCLETASPPNLGLPWCSGG